MGVVYQCLAVVLFVNRYIAGWIFRVIKGDRWDETDLTYEPTVTVIVPMFNEGQGIVDTLESLVALDYPRSKLEILCVDDGSTDNSLALADAIAARSFGLLRIIRNDENRGKRISILHATREAKGEIVVTVDSDVSVDADAITQLVQRFTSEQIAAVGGWVDVRNKHASWVARMQVVKYWYSYFLLKNIEWGFRRIMCLSGCLTAYRKRVLIEIEPALERRTLLGLPINYGEDRFLTRQIIKAGYQTTMTLSARCRTDVPTSLSKYFSQQLRWRRSAIVDYGGGLTHVWRLNPILAVHYCSLFALLFVYPLGVIRAIATGHLLFALVLHIKVLTVFGLYYRWRVRHQPAEERVGVLAVLPLAIIMPLSYALQTPLALFSLDSGSWETRDHQATLDAKARGEITASPPAQSAGRRRT